MRRICTIFALVLLVALLPAHAFAKKKASGSAAQELAAIAKEGDILFHRSNSRQCAAIRLATGSDYTHCGIILKQNGKLAVFEAIQPVGWESLDSWVKRGNSGHYVLMRLKDPSAITPEAIATMQEYTKKLNGKQYDILFQWSDETFYCSELVWKMYKKAANIELTPLRRFQDYKLDHKAVQAIIKERYGKELPTDEKVVAPSDLMGSNLLEVVKQN